MGDDVVPFHHDVDGDLETKHHGLANSSSWHMHKDPLCRLLLITSPSTKKNSFFCDLGDMQHVHRGKARMELLQQLHHMPGPTRHRHRNNHFFLGRCRPCLSQSIHPWDIITQSIHPWDITTPNFRERKQHDNSQLFLFPISSILLILLGKARRCLQERVSNAHWMPRERRRRP